MIHLLVIIDDRSNIDKNRTKLNLLLSLETNAGLNYWATNEPDGKCDVSVLTDSM